MNCPGTAKSPQTTPGSQAAGLRWELRIAILLLPLSVSYFSASWWYKYIFQAVHSRGEMLSAFAQGGGLGDASAGWGEGRYSALHWANIFLAVQGPIWYGLWAAYFLLTIGLFWRWHASPRCRGYVVGCVFFLLADMILLATMHLRPWSVT